MDGRILENGDTSKNNRASVTKKMIIIGGYFALSYLITILISISAVGAIAWLFR